MPSAQLTEKFVRHVKAEAGAERSIYWDESVPGFGLMVMSSGHRSWVLQYRSHGASRRLTISGALTLADARKQARKHIGRIADGADPVLEQRKAAGADKNTLASVVERYLKQEGRKLRTADKRRATLERHVLPKLGAMQIGDIRRSDINHLLDHIEDKSGRAMADQVLAQLRRICNWHAIRVDDYTPPFVRGMARRKPQERERDRVLTDDELRRIWTTAESYASPWGQFVRLLLLTAARRTEVAGMQWHEISETGWAIPAARYKTNIDVMLPLSKAARAVIAKLARIEDCDYVFTTDGRRPISGFSTAKLRFDIASGVTGWRLHDLRRTARSLLSRAGVTADIAERCLGHALPGVRGVYDRHRYENEMLQAFEALAAQIARIVDPQDNVVTMRGTN